MLLSGTTRFALETAPGVAAGLRAVVPVPFLAVVAVVLAVCGAEVKAQLADSSQHVRTRVVVSAGKVAPGSDLTVAVVFDHDEGWHINTNDPKVPPQLDSFLPIKTLIEVDQDTDTPLIAHTGFIQWPPAHTVNVALMGDPIPYDVFGGRAIAYLPVSVRGDAPPGTADLVVKVRFQACSGPKCLRTTSLRLPVTVQILAGSQLSDAAGGSMRSELFEDFKFDVWQRIRGGTPVPQVVSFNLFDWQFEIDASGGLGIAMLVLLAMLGGLLLNFTPCVLPVIPIKVLSLSQSAGHPGRCLALGLAMSAGLCAFWIVLGGAIALLTGFTAINQLFQHPPFTIGVGLVIAVMAVGMCGLFAVRLPQWVYAISPKQETAGGSFVFGVMTAVLSTPCTAPFMGSAAAWAVKQPPSVTLVTFAAIGAGMALPYLLLAAFPRLVEKLPRTGPGSELLKQVMGLLMLAAATYFVGVGITGWLARPPDPPSSIYWWFVFAFVTAAGLWLVYRTVRIRVSALPRAVFVSAGAVLVIGSVYVVVTLTDPGPIAWQYYTPNRFSSAVEQGKIVVMDFTAEWCLNCKALEHTQLHDARVVEALSQDGVVPMKVDLTAPYEVGKAKLAEVGSLTIPLLVVFDGRGATRFKSDFYTAEQVLGAIEEARGTGAQAPRSGI